jgi:hypothetical protein
MIFDKRPGGTPNVEWPDLVEELDLWGDAGRVAAFWWRDDDAVTATSCLDALLELTENIPLALAVIPARADRALAGLLADRPSVTVLQHGWKHTNHGGDGKKSEFPTGRPPHAIAEELAAGRDRLEDLFGQQAWPVLAPPWNRFAQAFVPLLPQAGLLALSRMAARYPAARAAHPGLALAGLGQSVEAARPLAEVDVHMDPVAWKQGGSFIGEGAALACLISHLRARRHGTPGADGPIGILTHHLVMDEPTWAFLHRLVALAQAHRAARWADAGELFLAGRRAAAALSR